MELVFNPWTILSGFLLLSILFARKHREEFFSELSLLSYCFSSGFILNCSALFFFRKFDLKDPSNTFISKTKYWADWLLSSAQDITTEFYVVFGIGFLIISPLMLTYLISGIFGRATENKAIFRLVAYVGKLSVFKTAATGARVATSTMIMLLIKVVALDKSPVQYLQSSVFLLSIAICVATSLHDAKFVHQINPISRLPTKIRRWCTRHQITEHLMYNNLSILDLSHDLIDAKSKIEGAITALVKLDFKLNISDSLMKRSSA